MRRAIIGLNGPTLLTGFRGSAAIDIDALSEIVARVSNFANDHRVTIAENGFNPLICGASLITIVSAYREKTSAIDLTSILLLDYGQ